MKSVVIGSTVYSNGTVNFSLECARVMGVRVIKDSDGVKTWIDLEDDGGYERAITAEVFFKNYTDTPPFFKLGFTYRNLNGGAVRWEITDLLKSDKSGAKSGLYALAKRHSSDGTYSYVVLPENDFRYMVQV